MTKYICLWILTFTLLVTPICKAGSELEIGGLLLDNTKSRLGHDFYYEFSRFWQDIPNKEGINVQIIEQIVPRAGTRLSILLNGRPIYATHFGRRQSPVKDKVEQAIFILIDAMARSQYAQDSLDMVGDGL
jgi:curli production assembly/transport component CsgE